MDIRLKIEFLTAKSIKGGRGCICLGKEESLFPPEKRKEFRVKGTEGFPGPENRDCRFRGRRDFRFRKRRDFRFRKRRDLESLLVIHKIAKSYHKLPKNWQKLPKVAKSCQKLPKVAKSCQK